MDKMPDFIKDFYEQLTDDEAAIKLQKLAKEYIEKLETLQKNKPWQHANNAMSKDLGKKPTSLNHDIQEKVLTNEFKLKTFSISNGKMDPSLQAQFEKKHEPEFIPERDPTMRALGETQENMRGLVDKFKARETTPPTNDKDEKARIRLEIKQQMDLRDEGKDKFEEGIQEQIKEAENNPSELLSGEQYLERLSIKKEENKPSAQTDKEIERARLRDELRNQFQQNSGQDVRP